MWVHFKNRHGLKTQTIPETSEGVCEVLDATIDYSDHRNTPQGKL